MSKGLVQYDKNESMKWFNEMLEYLAISMQDDFKYGHINGAVGAIYPFSNENLPETYDYLDPEGKKVLTVGSSGDQVLLALAKDAKKITLIDANPMSLAYLELKLAALKCLKQEEYMDMFYGDFLSHKYYAKVSHLLSPYVREFWEELYLNSSIQEFYKCNRFLFQPTMPREKAKSRINAYFNVSELYDNAKANLGKCEIDFKCASLDQFASSVDDKYDIILLSNVCDYVRQENLYYQIFALGHRLNNNGKIEMSYHFTSQKQDWLFMIENLAGFSGDMRLMHVNHITSKSNKATFHYNGVYRQELSCSYTSNTNHTPIITYATKEYLMERMPHLSEYVRNEIKNLLIKLDTPNIDKDECDTIS